MTAKSPWEIPDQEPPDNSSGPFRWGVWLLVIGGGALLLYFLSSAFGGSSGQTSDDTPRLVYLVVLLVAITASLFFRRQIALRQTLRHLSVWVLVFLVAIVGASFWTDLVPMKDRIFGALTPASPMVSGEGVVIHRRLDGHFWVEAEVEGTPILFMIDTGATNVVLAPKDAERIGLRLASLDFSQKTATANGTGSVAPIRLGEIAIGPLVVQDITASVNSADMDTSLLGMSFLNRLSGYSVDGERMTLKN